MSMFENYPTYMKEILGAAKHMSAEQKARQGKMGIAGIAGVALGGIVLTASGNAIASSQFDVAMGALKDGFSDNSVNIEVATDDQSQSTTLLAESSSPLSASDESAVVQQIKDCISSDKVVASDAKIVDTSTTELTITTADGIPVKVTLKKVDGAYKIDSATAMLDADAVKARKEQSSNPASTDVQKSAYASPLAEFDVESFDAFAGIDGQASDEDKVKAYSEHISAIAPEVSLTVPSGFTSQEVEQPESDDDEEETTDESVTAENVDAAVDGAVEAAAEQADERPSVKQYARSWKDGNGSSISVRAEDLGEAFSAMTGIDAVTKMKGYWEETSSSVASGAGQTLKNEEEGYVSETFYDEQSGLWGYWGHVVYTDGSRDIVYNRVVMIDEATDQMFTISYRNDAESADESKAYTLDDFKKLVTHAPSAEGSTAAIAVAWQSSMDSTLIKAGHSKTVAEETAEAAETATESKDAATTDTAK